mgnify:FL=1
MYKVPARNKTEATKFAIELSKKHKDKYITLYACFGIFANISKRLHIFAPSDSLFNSYFLNGKQKYFTTAQKISDEKATPALF